MPNKRQHEAIDLMFNKRQKYFTYLPFILFYKRLLYGEFHLAKNILNNCKHIFERSLPTLSKLNEEIEYPDILVKEIENLWEEYKDDYRDYIKSTFLLIVLACRSKYGVIKNQGDAAIRSQEDSNYILEKIIKYQDCNQTNEHKVTPLILAVVFGDKFAVKKLLEKNVHIDTQDYEGNTACHEAAANRNEEILGMLLEKGASLDIKNNDGYTALEWVGYADRNSPVIPHLEHYLLEKSKEISSLRNN